MKKYIAVTAFSLSLAILANVTGCSQSGNLSDISDSSVSATESTVVNSDSSDNSASAPESTDLGTPAVPKHELSEEAKALAAKLKQQGFIGPDGEEVVYLNDAADIYVEEDWGRYYNGDLLTDENGAYIRDENDMPKRKDDEWVTTVIKLDFGYMRYARPFFYTQDNTPDDVKMEELDKQFDELPDEEWFKIRAGDKLDCGLTVKSVEYLRYPIEYTPLIHHKVELDGEITLEGVVFATTNTNDYLAAGVGVLQFTPDPTKTANVPVFSTFYDFEGDRTESYYPNFGYVKSDLVAPWLIGHVDDDNFDEQAILGDDGAAMVRVTLKNLNVNSYDADFLLTELHAEIVDIERID